MKRKEINVLFFTGKTVERKVRNTDCIAGGVQLHNFQISFEINGNFVVQFLNEPKCD